MTTLPTPTLDSILENDAESVSHRLRGLYGAATGECGDRIVLYGAGHLGRRTLAGLRSIDIEPLAFVDSDPRRWGEAVDGIRIVSPKEALGRWAESATFVPTIYNGSPIRAFLKAEGCRAVASCPWLYWKHAETFLPYGGICRPEATLDHSDELRRTYALLADGASRAAFLGQLAWRLSLNDARLPTPSPAAETYFPPEILPIENEVFVDCGAFDGDSLEDLFGRYPQARAIAIEPDFANAIALRERMRRIGREDRVTVHTAAAASAPGSLAFAATGTAGSSLSPHGEVVVRCERLDDLLAEEVPTYLKMDVEGAESDALRGAQATIRKHRPVLAICLYHKPEDLWQIPLFVESLGVDYRYLLRVHAEECWEIVLYAVPAERWRG